MSFFRVLLFLPFIVCACSTTHVRPAISAFAESVQDTASAVETRFAREDVEGRFLESYVKAVVDARAILELEGCGRPLGVSEPLDSEKLSDFAVHCSLKPVTFDPGTGQVTEVEVRPPSGAPGVSGSNARRLAMALSTYAGSLKALAEAKTPTELGDSFGKAAAAVSMLAGEAAKIGGSPLSREELAALSTGGSLFSTLVTEAFETRRYNLVRNIVERADPRVELASRALAGWYREREQDELEAAYEALEEDAARQGRAVAALARGAGDERAAIAATTALRQRYDALAEQETGAAWRVFLDVARAHRAIMESLNEPASLDRVADANNRIIALVTKADAFVKAIEAARED